MSRAYKICVEQSENIVISGEDEVCTSLEVLNILPAEQMSDLLKEELKKEGFNENENGDMVKKDGNTSVVVDTCKG